MRRLVSVALLWWMVTLIGVGRTEEKIIQTNILFRHGDRSPETIFPRDAHQESSWPDKLGDLTQVGKAELVRLGRFLRKRYNSLLSDTYRPNEILVLSSDMNRTLMSAYSALTGLYPNDEFTQQNNQSQAILVHALPTHTDILLGNSRYCEKALEVVKGMVRSSGMLKIKSEFEDLLNLVREETGYKDKSMLYLAEHVSDTLVCERAHNMSWPLWASYSNISCPIKSLIPCEGRRVFDILGGIQSYMYSIPGTSRVYNKFRGGPLLLDMIQNMDKKVSEIKDDKSYKMVMYSAHDFTIIDLLSALKVYDGVLPHYTATVVTELYEISGGDDHMVKVFYKNITDSDSVYRLSIPGCGYSCPLRKFSSIYQSLKVDDWNKECDNNITTTFSGWDWSVFLDI